MKKYILFLIITLLLGCQDYIVSSITKHITYSTSQEIYKSYMANWQNTNNIRLFRGVLTDVPPENIDITSYNTIKTSSNFNSPSNTHIIMYVKKSNNILTVTKLNNSYTGQLDINTNITYNNDKLFVNASQIKLTDLFFGITTHPTEYELTHYFIGKFKYNDIEKTVVLFCTTT